MAAHRHTPEQIREKLTRIAHGRRSGATVSEACRTAEISPATYRRWAKRYGAGAIGEPQELGHSAEPGASEAARRKTRAREIARVRVRARSGKARGPGDRINRDRGCRNHCRQHSTHHRARIDWGNVAAFFRTQLERHGPTVLGAIRSIHAAVSKTPSGSDFLQRKIIEAVKPLVARIPDTAERRVDDPTERCQAIIHAAASKAATVSGGLSLPFGPLAVLTLLPDLIFIWRIQAQMVADIAGVHGKQGALLPEHMVYCLFKHAASQAMRDVLVRAGERFLLQQGPMHLLKRAAGRLGLPVIGAAAVGAYAYLDTVQVGTTAIGLCRDELPSAPRIRRV